MLRAALLIPAGLLGTWLLLRWTTELLEVGLTRVPDVVAVGGAAGGALLTSWYTLTAVVLLLADLAGLSRRAHRLACWLRAAIGRFGAPVLRRAALVGVGAGLVLGAAPAGAQGTGAVVVTAAADETASEGGVPLDLRPGLTSLTVDGGGIAPHAPNGPNAAPQDADAAGTGTGPGDAPPDAETGAPARTGGGEAPRTPQDRSTTADDAHVTVRRGDSLWSIAAARLGADATAEQIAAEWPRWYQANRAVIGADPDLIHPGQRLLAPDPKETP